MVVFSATVLTQGNQQTTYNTQFFPLGLPTGKYHVWLLGIGGQITQALGTGSGCMTVRNINLPTNLSTRDYQKAQTINTIPFTTEGVTQRDMVYGLCMTRGEARTSMSSGQDSLGGWYMGIWTYEKGKPVLIASTFGGQFLRNGIAYFQAYSAE